MNRLPLPILIIVLIIMGVFGSTSFASDSGSNGNSYRIGQPLTLFLYDSNLNLDSDQAETYTLDLIRFESDKVKTTLGPKGGAQKDFDPRPSALRETGDNTGVFYTVIKIPRTVKSQTIDPGEKIEFEYTQRGLGAKLVAKPGTFSPDMLDLPANNGKVYLKAKSFRFGQPVEVILNDPDLNLKHDRIDIYSVINDPNSPFVDTVGTASGGILLEIKIKDIRYQRCTIDGVEHGGLASSGFSLVETGPSTGIFKGVFKIPQQICDKTGTKLITSAGGNIKVRYFDFRDSFGQPSIQTN